MAVKKGKKPGTLPEKTKCSVNVLMYSLENGKVLEGGHQEVNINNWENWSKFTIAGTYHKKKDENGQDILVLNDEGKQKLVREFNGKKEWLKNNNKRFEHGQEK